MSKFTNLQGDDFEMVTKSNVHKLYLFLSAGIVGFAVVYGMFRDGSIVFHPLRTFTYQSNILMAICFVLMALIGNDKKIRHYLSISVLVAITVTGLVYNFVLVPFTSSPMFYIGFVNFVTHALSTLLAIINYFAFEEKGYYHPRHIVVSMIFPAVYWVVFVSIGDIINWYPYFFMNPHSVGWVMVFVWLGILLGTFALLSFLLMLFDRKNKNN